MDFTQFAAAESQNKSLKKFLDVHRLEYALHYKIVGLPEKSNFYLNDIATKIPFKTKLLLVTPSFILRFLLTLKQQLKKIGITCIPDYDWREATALGRAEWILLFGVLSDRLPEALKLFKTIEQSYLKTIRTPQQHNALNMISGNVTGDFWYTPAGESFLAEIYKRAGLSYVYASTKGTGSLAYSMEKILKDGAGVQLWLNPGFPSKQAILNANPKVLENIMETVFSIVYLYFFWQL